MKRGKQRVRLDLLPPDQFQSLIEAVKHKEETAWRFFFKRYAPFTDQFIEDSCFRTDQPLREGIDACDIRQLTFMSLLRYRARMAVQESQFIKDLCLLAWKQFHRYCRWATAYKRSLQLQVPFVLVRHDKLTRVAGPAECAACADASRHTLAGISEQAREVVTGLDKGEPRPELAARLGISERTLEREVQRAKEREALC